MLVGKTLRQQCNSQKTPKKCVQFCNNIYDKGMPYSNCASLFSKDSLEEKGGVKYAIAVGAAL